MIRMEDFTMPRKKNVYKEPSIRLRKDGLYEARIYIGINPETHKQVVESVYGKTQKEVKEKALIIQKQKSQNKAMNLQRFNVRSWLDKWLNDYKYASLKASTYDNYLVLSNQFIVPALGETLLDRLTRDDIRAMFSGMIENSYSSSTVHNVHKILHGALEQAVLEGLISLNPSDKINLPRLVTQEKNALSEIEIQKLLSVLTLNSFDNGILFMLNSGLRVGEMLALRWADVNYENMSFTISRTVKRTYIRDSMSGQNSASKTALTFESPKTKNSIRCLPLTDKLSSILGSQRDYIHTLRQLNVHSYIDSGLIFSTEKGTPIDPRNFNRHLEIICKRATIPVIQSHIFRHTFISIAVREKMDPILLKRIVGHSSFNVTDAIYTHLSVDDLRESMDKLK